MATQISTLAVKLTASAGAFSSTMAGAGKQLASFGSSITSIGSKVIGFGGALTALAAGGSLLYMTKQSMEAIDVNAKLSDRLGISTEALTGLQHAAGLAGISNESLTGGLEKMLKTIGGVADDGENVSNAFTKLGLSAATLANMPTDQAFSAIAQKLTEIPNAAERAAAATQIFGKAGQNLLPLLMSGAEGIKAAQEEAAKLGVSYSRVDAAKVEQANDAITRMSSVWTGVTNQLAIGLAPYIEAAANKMTELTTIGGGLGPKVGGAVEWIAKAFAVAADYVNLLPAAFHGFRAGALTAIAGVLTAVDYLGGGLVKLLNLLPGVNVEWTDTFGNMAEGLNREATAEAQKFDDSMAAFSRGDATQAVGKVFDDIKAKSAASAQATADNAAKMGGAFRNLEDHATNLKKVSETLEQLQKDVSQAGMSDSQKKVADLQTNGASAVQIQQAKKLLDIKDQLDAVSKISSDDPLTDFAAKMEKLQQLYAQGKVAADQFGNLRDEAKKTLNDKLSESAKSITDDVKSPLEKYQNEVGKLNDLLERGLITKDTFDKANVKAQSTLQSATEKAQPPAVAAIKSGSAEAMKLAFESTHGVQILSKDDLPKKQLGEAVTANRFLDQQTRYLKDIANATAPQEVDI